MRNQRIVWTGIYVPAACPGRKEWELLARPPHQFPGTPQRTCWLEASPLAAWDPGVWLSLKGSPWPELGVKGTPFHLHFPVSPFGSWMREAGGRLTRGAGSAPPCLLPAPGPKLIKERRKELCPGNDKIAKILFSSFILLFSLHLVLPRSAKVTGYCGNTPPTGYPPSAPQPEGPRLGLFCSGPPHTCL